MECAPCQEVFEISAAHAVTPVAAIQNIYSTIDGDTEKPFPTFEELGITFFVNNARLLYYFAHL